MCQACGCGDAHVVPEPARVGIEPDKRWRFEPHPDGCEVDFQIAYEFKSRLLSAVLASNFDRAVTKLMGCFEMRARAMYAPVVSAGLPGAPKSASA